MLLGVPETVSMTPPLPVLAPRTTALVPFGQRWFSQPTATWPHVLLSAGNDFLHGSSPLTMPNASASKATSSSFVFSLASARNSLKMCVVPDLSRRTTRLISSAGLHPVPETESPFSVISLHFVIEPR